jgi:succinoglycan biosynthesis transport protein ExoP
MIRSALRSASTTQTYVLFTLAFGLIGALAALAITLATTPQYQAKATLYVSTAGGSPVNNASYQETAASQQIALSLSKLITTGEVMDKVNQDLQLNRSPAQLASLVGTTVEPETVLIDLTVRDSSPALARDIANATALAFTDFVENLQVKASPSTPKPQVTLVEPAITPEVPITPNATRNVGLGVLGGLAVGLVLANLRDRVKSKQPTA